MIVWMSTAEHREFFGLYYIVGDQFYLLMFMLGFIYFYNHKQEILSKYTVIRNTVITCIYSFIFIFYFNMESTLITYAVIAMLFFLYLALDALDRWINKLVRFAFLNQVRKILREAREGHLPADPQAEAAEAHAGGQHSDAQTAHLPLIGRRLDALKKEKEIRVYIQGLRGGLRAAAHPQGEVLHPDQQGHHRHQEG